jgi:hypothetical protein
MTEDRTRAAGALVAKVAPAARAAAAAVATPSASRTPAWPPTLDGTTFETGTPGNGGLGEGPEGNSAAGVKAEVQKFP